MELFDYEREHIARLRPHLAECTVLLKKDGSFPLSAPCAIAAYGSGVRGTVKGGTGSGEVNSRYFVTVEEGLKRAGFTVTTGEWLDGWDALYAREKKAFRDRLMAEARAKRVNPMIYGSGKVMNQPECDLPLSGDGEAAIYVVSRVSGEGNDRTFAAGDIGLTRSEIRDILALNERYEKFMLVLNVGGMVDLSGVEGVRNVLLLSQLGVETGDALAEILLGRQNPSGKLATTWADREDACSVGTFGDPHDTYYNEGIYVGYRYFDSVGKRARYPFGFGLSYTEFQTGAERVSLSGSVVTVRASVTNAGAFPGKEVVQVYLSAPRGKLDKPWQDLAGFAKTADIRPGGDETVEVTFDLKDMASYDESRSCWILEAGDYVVRVGASSVDTTPAAVIRLAEEAVVTRAKKCFGDPGFADWKPEAREQAALPGGIPVLSLDSAAVETAVVDYDTPYEIDPAVERLTDEQLAYAHVGAFNPRGGMSMIGNASTTVAGAAGETTGMLKDAGFKTLVMADGPAGIRLAPRCWKDDKGSYAIGQLGFPDSMAEMLPGVVKWALKKLNGKRMPRGTKVEYQYCTAMPIGTALAQSWNLELARLCGHIAGAEMARFGVHLWLAPAMNIHRSVLCGRDFEYFSEDPLISGKMAAALTQGVQAHPGRGVTIKHYAANNQETNRTGSNSRVSERALREIYLKGFGICVREAHPTAVMTSYNLVNGQHTAESRDLCEAVLRREYGFDGIAMSDWVVGDGKMNSRDDIHPAVKPQRAAAAGGELFMPGCKADYNNILKGLETGEVTREQLRINATRLYRMTRRLAGEE